MDQVVITLRGQVKDDIIHDTIHKRIKAKGQSIYADRFTRINVHASSTTKKQPPEMKHD